MIKPHSEAGFSLIELIVATAVLLTVSAIVTNALMQMTNAQTTIWNRTEMHSGIRGATELLQQEVGQAGRVSFPGIVTLGQAIDVVGGSAPAASAACDPGSPMTSAAVVQVLTTATGAGVTAVSGMWANAGPPASYIILATLDGDQQETIKVGAFNGATTPATITACFTKPHAMGTVIAPVGGFANGIIPDVGISDPSTTNVLKMFGDINGDGKMVYVEYVCDTTAQRLYRNVMPYDASTKPMPTESEVLLSNIIPNPGGTPCFTYQTSTMLVQGTSFTFVLDVAITLTVQTQQIDPLTREFQTETKALLNVSPRNVFNAWSLASIGYTDRVQSTPVTVTALMP